MSKVSCEIIRDMLPLYYDNVCSDDSKRMVEEHLDKCDGCIDELNRIKCEIKIPKEEIESSRNDVSIVKNISYNWKRSRNKSFIKGIIISALLFLVIFLVYFGLFQWHVTNVPTDVVEIKNVSELSDGKIVYHVKLTDGYRLNIIKYEMDESGNFYLTPYRPIIKEKAEPPYALQGYQFFNVKAQEKNHNGAEIKALYYGTPDDNILIWKKGMDLPKASEEIESMFHFE